MIDYVLENYEVLDKLCYELQNDYNNGGDFKQGEESRLVIANILEYADRYKKVKDLKEPLYLSVMDLQCNDSDGFGSHRLFTASEWKENAIEWCETDESIELAEYIESQVADKKLVEYIADTWDLQIEQLNPFNDTHWELLKEWNIDIEKGKVI